MKETPFFRASAALVALACLSGPGMALDLALPAEAVAVATRSTATGSLRLPTGPYRAGDVPSLVLEGAVEETAWQIPNTDLSALALLAPLRAQVREAGFDILLDCEAFGCGGFDFRYTLTLLPEPEMHVDLGDFHYLSAMRGDEGISIVTSRSATTGFVQITHLGTTGPAPALSAMPRAGQTEAEQATVGERLLTQGSVILEGLRFAPGSGALDRTDGAAITALARWLAENPSLSIALVGHTDASGPLEGNITLSRQRAEAVRRVLTETYGIDPGRIEAQGVGYLAPIANNLTEDGRRLNRRVEAMVVTPRAAP